MVKVYEIHQTLYGLVKQSHQIKGIKQLVDSLSKKLEANSLILKAEDKEALLETTDVDLVNVVEKLIRDVHEERMEEDEVIKKYSKRIIINRIDIVQAIQALLLPADKDKVYANLIDRVQSGVGRFHHEIRMSLLRYLLENHRGELLFGVEDRKKVDTRKLEKCFVMDPLVLRLWNGLPEFLNLVYNSGMDMFVCDREGKRLRATHTSFGYRDISTIPYETLDFPQYFEKFIANVVGNESNRIGKQPVFKSYKYAGHFSWNLNLDKIVLQEIEQDYKRAFEMLNNMNLTFVFMSTDAENINEKKMEDYTHILKNRIDDIFYTWLGYYRSNNAIGKVYQYLTGINV